MKFGVALELFLLAKDYCDVATLAHFASATGGELHYFKNYQVKGVCCLSIFMKLRVTFYCMH